MGLCSLVIFFHRHRKNILNALRAFLAVIPTILFTKVIEIEASQWDLREMGSHISYTATNKNHVDLYLQITCSSLSF
jgi:hypothetical protein